MKKVAIFAFAGLLLVAGVIYFGFYQHSGPFVPPKGTVLLRVSKETTIVTEPLLPCGNAIDFFAVLDQLTSAHADSEENGFREIIRLVGRNIFDNISDEKWKILCEKLNLSPDEPPQYHYLPLHKFIEDAGHDNPWQMVISLERREENITEHLELLERWGTEMYPAISAVAVALKKPLYVIPTTGRQDVMFEEFGLDEKDFDWPDFLTGMIVQRGIARMFSCRRLYRELTSEANNSIANWDDAISKFRVARHMGQQPDGLSIAVALEKMAAYHAKETLKNEVFNADTLRQCLADLEALPDLLNVVAYWEYLRFGWLKNISEFPERGPAAFKLRTMPIPEDVSWFTWFTEEDKRMYRQINREIEKAIRLYRQVPFDWNIVAEIMNAEFDELQGKPTKQTIFQSNLALRKIYDEMVVPEYPLDQVLALTEVTAWERLKQIADEDWWNVRRWRRMSIEERSVYLGKMNFAGYATPPEVFAHQSREAVIALEMLKTLIALQLHNVEHGNYPATLDELVERGYLTEVPRDLFHKDLAPLIYRIEPDGSHVLYSVGPNGIDDGGETDTSWRLGEHRRDDIVVRLD